VFVRLVSRNRPGRIPLALALVAIACLWAPPANAQAASRYVAPMGSDETEHCLNPASPCSLQTALKAENSVNGDTILLAPGLYEEKVETLEIPHSVTISGEPGEPAPTIQIKTSSPFSPGWGFIAPESVTLRDLRIHTTEGVYAGFALEGTGNLVERVESVGPGFAACDLYSGTIKDSFCQVAAGNRYGSALQATFKSATPASATLKVQNVTAIGNANAIEARFEESANLTVEVENTIAFVEHDHPIGEDEPGAYDVEVFDKDHAGGSGAMVLSHSNFNSSRISGSGSITSSSEAGNQSALPVFVDPLPTVPFEAARDFREKATSPTVDAGDLGVVEPGDLDLDGVERTTACGAETFVDIGAYQLGECPSGEEGEDGETPDSRGTTLPDASISNPASTHSTPAAGPLPAATAPQLSGLKLKHPRRSSRGATISFNLSSAAEVKLEVLRVRRADDGGPKLVPLGSLPPIAGAAGPNLAHFSGVLKGKPLNPGKYTLRATATAAGLSSAPATRTFTVLAPTS
jgi:hypothetical protein